MKKGIRQAIETKFIGPTDKHWQRIRVKCSAKTVFLNWDDNLDVEGNHLQAANLVFNGLGWNRDNKSHLVTGSFDGLFYHVQTDKSEETEK